MSSTSADNNFTEWTMDVPWGVLAGKWWGPKNIRPIVALHGWQDNAGTFDKLIPLLPNHVSYLALDLPGHGLSSHIPLGENYGAYSFVHTLHMVFSYFKWEKVSIMAHSMSSIFAFMLAAMFPDKFDMVIGIDFFKPHVRPPPDVIEYIKYLLEGGLQAYHQLQKNVEPPCYEYEEVIAKFCNPNTVFPFNRETAECLVKRGVIPSKIHPNKYYFARDIRLKLYNRAVLSQDTCLEMARRITAPYCLFEILDTWYVEDKKYHHEAVEVIKKSNPNFEWHGVHGNHYVHVSNPMQMSGIISNFINKYRPPNTISKI